MKTYSCRVFTAFKCSTVGTSYVNSVAHYFFFLILIFASVLRAAFTCEEYWRALYGKILYSVFMLWYLNDSIIMHFALFLNAFLLASYQRLYAFYHLSFSIPGSLCALWLDLSHLRVWEVKLIIEDKPGDDSQQCLLPSCMKG